MKKLVVSIISLVSTLSFSSCDKNCEGCGSSTSWSYKIRNNLELNLELITFRQGVGETINDTLVINPLSEKTVFAGTASNTLIDFIGNDLIDSCHLYKDDMYVTTYFKNKCLDESNPLCTSNYELVNESEDKKGNKFKNYVLEL